MPWGRAPMPWGHAPMPGEPAPMVGALLMQQGRLKSPLHAHLVPYPYSPSRFTVWWPIIHSSLVGTTRTSILLSRAWMRVAWRSLAAG